MHSRMTVYDEGYPRGMWKLGRIKTLIEGADGRVRGARMRVVSRKGQPRILWRPIQHVYSLEVRCEYQEKAQGPKVFAETRPSSKADKISFLSQTPT
jgi:hypothetical protein